MKRIFAGFCDERGGGAAVHAACSRHLLECFEHFALASVQCGAVLWTRRLGFGEAFGCSK
jgi:hypothetical protein